MAKFFISYFLYFIFFLTYSYAQTSSPLGKSGGIDSVHIHSPKKAVILSAIIPGSGQAYNKKYWKMPVVYAAMGITVYLFDYNNKLYKEYKRSYISKTDTLSGIIDTHPDKSASQVRKYETTYHKHRDLSIILTALFYTLNIADAYVDAHLMTFDVSDNLSMNIMPSINLYSSKQKPSAGFTLSLRF
ncbi:MAG: hypothetical protein HY840_15025 [Bacteroidetes bacterium]|nr:hypothetical protein [Bacteroidota bacterium]